MPARRLILPKKVQKSAHKLPVRIQKKFLDALIRIKHDPVIGIKLHGELMGYYKYRLGDYRIVYMFISGTGTVEVVKIEHRQGVYK